MTDELGRIEEQLASPFDMPKEWRSWVTRFLMQIAVDRNSDAALAQRFKAVELLLRIDAINKAAVPQGGTDDARGADAIDELDAVRQHLLPLLGSPDDTTEELARQAVAEIVQLRGRLPAPQDTAE